MILKGSQRGGASRLAAHLMNIEDNDHITLHEVRGFIAQSLHGALNEADAISYGTRCKQFLFSLSLNPPINAEASVDDLVNAIDRAEDKLGLNGQPRAIVIHEKNGRRHAHAVWSRIDAREMKAVNLPHFKNKLASLSKALYLEHGWELPRGHRENDWKNPLNFSLEEWQQAKRLGMDPREIKQLFHEAFVASDGVKAFKAALEDSGYYLAKGDRRGIVAVDIHSKVYSVARWAGVKTKELRAKFGTPADLPSVDQTRTMISATLSKNMYAYMDQMRRDQRYIARPLNIEREDLVALQRRERKALKNDQARRQAIEARARAQRYRSGLMGVVDLLFGKRRAIRKENEADLARCRMRDQSEREALFKSQMQNRHALQKRIEVLRRSLRDDRRRLIVRMADVLAISREMKNQPEQTLNRGRGGGREFSLDL